MSLRGGLALLAAASLVVAAAGCSGARRALPPRTADAFEPRSDRYSPHAAYAAGLDRAGLAGTALASE